MIGTSANIIKTSEGMDTAGILSKEVSVFSLATMIFSQIQSAIWLIWKNYLIYSTLFPGSSPTRTQE